MRKVAILTIILDMVFLFQGPAIAHDFPYVVNDFSFYPVPDTPRPHKCDYRSPEQLEFCSNQPCVYVDPVFHTQIVRITDRTIDEQGKYRRCHPGYPKHDIENADGTLLLVETGYSSNWCFWEANPPYRRVGCVPPKYIGFGGRVSSIRWDNEDPHTLYFTMKGKYEYAGIKFWKYTITYDESRNMTDGTMECLHDFQEEIDKYWPHLDIRAVSWFEEGDASDDRRYWAWAVVAYGPNHDPHWWKTAMIVYDKDFYGKDNGKVIAVLNEGEEGFRSPGFVSMSPSGKYVWTGDAHRLYTRDLVYSRDPRISWGHADMAISAEGKEVIVGFAKQPGTGKKMAAMEDLETGEVTRLAPIAAAGHHVSGNNHLRPGWAVYSTYTPKYPDVPTSWGQHEVYMVELTIRKDPPPKVWRLAHTHTVRKGYVDDPFGKINRRGTKVWFSSGWGCSKKDEGCELDVYQINLPLTWYEDLSHEIRKRGYQSFTVEEAEAYESPNKR
jgi:hypothetical protein